MALVEHSVVIEDICFRPQQSLPQVGVHWYCDCYVLEEKERIDTQRKGGKDNGEEERTKEGYFSLNQ